MLQQLRIWHNSDLVVEPSFLTALTRCNHLEKLMISGTSFQGTLPTSIGNLSTSMQKFTAEGCNILGTIPDEIGNLSNIMVIVLSSNRLKGFIPKKIQQLKKLQWLELMGNELSGVIPDQLCDLQALYRLYLNDNIFSEQIPNCLSNLSSLEYLHLPFNRLTSEIPSSIWDLTKLLELNLASNYLFGSLPPRIGNSKGLIYMDLSGNQLSGDIPESIGGLSNLQNLSLAQNHFQGIIPESMGNMVSLESLDLSANNLAGLVPKTMESLRYLKQLNVSKNGLWGEIPSGGPFANMSSESFMLNLGLCGLPKFGVKPCPQPKVGNKKFGKLLIAIVASVVLSLAIVAFILMVMMIPRPKKNIEDIRNTELLQSVTWRRISLLELERATNGFDDCNILGRGSFGCVYKGVLADGTDVAVKVFDDLEREANDDDGSYSNDNECEVLRNLRHKNIIKILSTCYTTGFRALILEFMPSGSLHKWLYSHNYFLDIFKRLDIMIDVALALEYLHQGYSVPIVHCDLKPSNVLLDGDLVAHIGDFGISKFLGNGNSVTQTLTLATMGYMAPELGMEGIVSTKSDIYSFGILVMEVFTRRNPTEESFQEGMDIKQWVRTFVPMGITEYADANLLNCSCHKDLKAEENCISSVMKVALQCCEDTPRDRMVINDVLINLKKIKSKFLQDIH
ncbi:unnamed protein product [Linum trigynum]|uniref:non-specific serine/threonine protein kinase n=1 Tax=Linum trigynum TaxID=586398 RepID=A0AAV2GU00_9ROSI